MKHVFYDNGLIMLKYGQVLCIFLACTNCRAKCRSREIIKIMKHKSLISTRYDKITIVCVADHPYDTAQFCFNDTQINVINIKRMYGCIKMTILCKVL